MGGMEVGGGRAEPMNPICEMNFGRLYFYQMDQTRPLEFLIFTTAFKKFAWSPRALGHYPPSDFEVQPVNIERFCIIAKKMRLDPRIRMHRSRASGASNLSRYGRFCARPLISYLMDFLNMRCGVCRKSGYLGAETSTLMWE